MAAELARRFASEKTSLGEPIQVVPLDRSEGVVERDDTFMEHWREQLIKEYFFGSARRSLSPQNQQVDFDSLVIYKAPKGASTVLDTPPPLSPLQSIGLDDVNVERPMIFFAKPCLVQMSRTDRNSAWCARSRAP